MGQFEKKEEELKENGQDQTDSRMDFAQEMRARVEAIERQKGEKRSLANKEKLEDLRVEQEAGIRRKVVDMQGVKGGFHLSVLGILAFVFDVIASILVIIYLGKLLILSVVPFAGIALFCSYTAGSLDSSKELAILSGLIAILLLIIGLLPLVELVAGFILIGGGGV